MNIARSVPTRNYETHTPGYAKIRENTLEYAKILEMVNIARSLGYPGWAEIKRIRVYTGIHVYIRVLHVYTRKCV